MHRLYRTTQLVACLMAVNSVAIAQPNTAPSKVFITPEHVLSIDGRKVFPIGFGIPPAPDAKTPTGKPALQELRSAGALLLRTGPVSGGRRRSAASADPLA